ncbi:hypothetical protein ACXR2U_14625 [Jatrophihabitans sp. YIM 134969]
MTATTEAALLTPADVATLRSTGALRVFVPARFGGTPGTVADAARRIADVAAWNADAGWLAAVAAVTNLAVVEFPEAAGEQIWRRGPDVLVAGTLAPAGHGRRSGSDLVVDAVAAPSSGLDQADWVTAIVHEAGAPSPVRVLVPVAEVRIERTWEALGLNGARGDTAHLQSVRVPATRWRRLPPAGSAAPLPFFATLFFAAAVVGTARAASRTVAAAAAGPAPRWERPDVRAAVSGAVRRVDRAEALLEGAIAPLGSRDAVDAATATTRAAAADLAVSAVGAAETAMPMLIGAFGPLGLAPAHPLARALCDVVTGARHTALSPTKAALAHEAALADQRSRRA